MRFVDDTELTVFLWRHVSPTLDMRKLVLETNDTLTTRLEELVLEAKTWRFSENDLSAAFEKLPKNEDLLGKLKELNFVVEKEREREFIDESFGLNVTVESSNAVPENLIEPVCLLASVVSLAVYPKDILSTSFLLSALCPAVLPALKRISASKKLNLAQALVSYIQKAVIDNNAGEDPVMKDNIYFLKNLLKAIEDIHDKFDEVKSTRMGLRAAFEIANKFLVLCETSGNLSSALKEVYTLIDAAVENYVRIQAVAPNLRQSKPSFFNEIERVCQSVVDRLTIVARITNITSFSPSLRTPAPRIQTPSRTFGTFVANNVAVATPIIKTPITRACTFINNNTPTPIRNPVQALQDLLEAEKENIDPNAGGFLVEMVAEKDSVTPARSKKERGLRVRKCLTNSNQAKRAPTQRSILTFFKQ